MQTSKGWALVLLLTLVFLSTQTAVKAQTGASTTIRDLKYPAQAVLENGAARAEVTYTVSYTSLPSGGYLGFGILYIPHGSGKYVTGSGTSAPDSCQSNAGSRYVDSALCVIKPSTSSGTESVSFSLRLNSTQQYALYAVSVMVDNSGKAVSEYSFSDFTISVITQLTSRTSETTATSTPVLILGISVIAIPAFIIGVVVGFLIGRRGKRASTGGPAAEFPVTSTIPLTPTARTEGTKFCAGCGARIPADSGFCGNCGAKQN